MFILRIFRAQLDKSLSNIIVSHGWTYTEQLVGLETSWGPCQVGLSCDPRSFNSLYSPDFKVQFLYENKLETDSRDSSCTRVKWKTVAEEEELPWDEEITTSLRKYKHLMRRLFYLLHLSVPFFFFFFSHIFQQGDFLESNCLMALTVYNNAGFQFHLGLQDPDIR